MRPLKGPYEGDWEVAVQGEIKNLKPPYLEPDVMLVAQGPDLNRLEGVILGHIDIAPPTAEAFLALGAIAIEHRGKGGYLADEMFDAIFRRFEHLAREVEGVVRLDVEGNVHPRNTASKALLERQQFSYLKPHGEFERWYTFVDL